MEFRITDFIEIAVWQWWSKLHLSNARLQTLFLQINVVSNLHCALQIGALTAHSLCCYIRTFHLTYTTCIQHTKSLCQFCQQNFNYALLSVFYNLIFVTIVSWFHETTSPKTFLHPLLFSPNWVFSTMKKYY